MTTRRTIRDNPLLERQIVGLQPLPGGIPATEAEAEALCAEAEAVVGLRSKPGRPKAGQRTEPTATRSVRLPDALWKELDHVAERRHVSANRAAAEAIARYVHQADE